MLCKIIQEQCPGIETLSLQNNKLRSVSWFSTLALRLPNLRNLSLSNNLIPNYKSLENIKGAKFLKLRELVLTGNPVYDREVQKAGNAEIYRKNICKIFPTIEILDMEPVLRVMPIIRSKYEIYGGFIDDPTTQAAAFGFLESYFTLFDAADRKALGSYYSDQAVFSLCVNVIRPNGSSTTSSGVPNLKYFSDWIRLDRNLDKLKSPERRASRLAVGPVQICSLLTDLPTTSHPIRSDPALKLFMVDAFQQNSELGALLYINIHGQMTVNNSGKKSFDRTFVLAPAAPGSRAMAKGYPVCIVNDMLVIRHFEAEPAWLQQVDRAQPGHVAPIVNPYHQLPTPEIIEQYRVACQLVPLL